MAFIVPPGGFAGFSQMTPASRAALSRIGGSRGGSSGRRRRTKKRGASSKRRTARGSSRKRLPKFGSPAWRKKYNLGKKRRRRA